MIKFNKLTKKLKNFKINLFQMLEVLEIYLNKMAICIKKSLKI